MLATDGDPVPPPEFSRGLRQEPIEGVDAVVARVQHDVYDDFTQVVVFGLRLIVVHCGLRAKGQ